IPAYNAAATLGDLFSRLRSAVSLSDVVVVDDGSTDETAGVCVRNGVRVIRLENNLGKGAALRKSFEVLKNEPEVEGIITLDADLQHRPEDIQLFLETKARTNAELIVGRRKKLGTRMPLHRRFSNSVTSFLVSARTGVRIPDSQCGFRYIARRAFSDIACDSPGFEAETEFLIRAVKRGFSVEFVPIETVYDGAKSHMTNWTTTLNFIRVLFREY
ncbi:MAG TPA: glycosyltransferase family 2 protein, partial [Bacteroidota bacterium]